MLERCVRSLLRGETITSQVLRKVNQEDFRPHVSPTFGVKLDWLHTRCATRCVVALSRVQVESKTRRCFVEQQDQTASEKNVGHSSST